MKPHRASATAAVFLLLLVERCHLGYGDSPAPPAEDRGGAAGRADSTPASAAVDELMAQAEAARKAGDFRRAASIGEKAVAVDPRRPDLRRQLVAVYGALAREQLQAGGERTREQLTTGAADYFRGMDHLEAYLADATRDDVRQPRRPSGETFVAEFVRSAQGFVLSGQPAPEVVEAAAAFSRKERDAFLRIARRRARDRRGDESEYISYAASGLDAAATFEFLASAVEGMKDLPGSAERVKQLTSQGVAGGALHLPPGRRFIERLAASDNADIRTAAEELRAGLPALEERMRQQTELVKKLSEPPAAVPAPADAGNDAVAFDPLDFPERRVGLHSAMLPPIFCLAAGDGTDVWWDRTHLWVMRQKNVLMPLYEADRNAMINEPCFDGKYVWAPVVLHEPKEPLFLVADPRTRQVWEVTAADGLGPTSGGIEAPGASGFGQAQAAPLSPGRACLAGAGNGRAWVALATFDPAAGRANVRIIHEATEPANQDDKDHWRRPQVLFNPLWMRTVMRWRVNDRGGNAGDKAPGAERGATRVLVGRGSSSFAVASHLLLIDPDGRERPSVTGDPLEAVWNAESVGAHGPAAYCPWYPEATAEDGPQGPGLSLWRLGFPDFKKESAARNVLPPADHPQRFSVAFARGRTYVFGEQLWMADTPEGPYRRVSGTPPQFTNGGGDPCLRESNHYGLVLTAGGRAYGARFAK